MICAGGVGATARNDSEGKLSDQIIDRAALSNLLATVGGDEAFLAEMIDTFLDDAPKLLAAMHHAAAANAEELRRAAHTLKSNSANFGAMNLSKMCNALEEIGKSGTLAGAAEGIARMETEYARVKRALETARSAGQ